MPQPDRLISVDEAAARVGVHHQTIRRWVREGHLSCYRFGLRYLRIEVDELDAFVSRPVTLRGGDSNRAAS